MSGVFKNQAEARAFIEGIEQARRRVFLEAVLSRSMSYLLQNEGYRVAIGEGQLFDLLLQVETVNAVLEREDLVNEIHTGRHLNLDSALEACGLW